MPESEPKLFRVKNVSKSDRTLAGGLVLAGEVIEVPEDGVYGLTCQPANWAPADPAAKKIHEKAHAEQEKRNQPPEPEPGDEESAPADADKEN